MLRCESFDTSAHTSAQAATIAPAKSAFVDFISQLR